MADQLYYGFRYGPIKGGPHWKKAHGRRSCPRPISGSLPRRFGHGPYPMSLFEGEVQRVHRPGPSAATLRMVAKSVLAGGGGGILEQNASRDQRGYQPIVTPTSGLVSAGERHRRVVGGGQPVRRLVRPADVQPAQDIVATYRGGSAPTSAGKPVPDVCRVTGGRAAGGGEGPTSWVRKQMTTSGTSRPEVAPCGKWLREAAVQPRR